MMMDSLDRQSGECSSEADIYAQVDRLFREAVQFPADERVEWVRRQDLDPLVARQVVATLAADMRCEGDTAGTADRDPALAAAAYAMSTVIRAPGPRSLPCIPNYEIMEEIARGGMGVVYRARQNRPERTVAIKMMRLGSYSSPNDVQRFLNEANAAAVLNHPAVVPVYEVGEISGFGKAVIR